MNSTTARESLWAGKEALQGVSFRQQKSALNVEYLKGWISEEEWRKQSADLNALIKEERENVTPA